MGSQAQAARNRSREVMKRTWAQKAAAGAKEKSGRFLRKAVDF
jgi:hypothetical protein